jgi:hypothetical protein
MEVLLAFGVAALSNVAVLLLLQRRYEPGLYRTVAMTYLGTLGLRYALAVYLWLTHGNGGVGTMFWGDSETYDFFGMTIAQGWADGANITSWSSTLEGRVNRGFIYVVAVVYYVFGHNTLLMQFLNGIIGALVPIAILDLALLLYDRKIAIRAMVLTAFFPQMIFWSSALYKDAAVMLCIAANMLLVLRLKQRFSSWNLLLYLASAVALVWLRFYIFYAVMAATVAGFLVGQRRGLLVGLLSQIGVVVSVLLLFLLTSVGQEVYVQNRFLSLETLNQSRMDLASADSGFAETADVSTISGALSVLPIGVAHLLFAPFPWTVTNLRQLLAIPDVLVWYALMPSLLRGFVSAIRYRLGQTVHILVFTTALTLAYGAFLGNVGTAYRQRTQIMMFYFIFIADGLTRRKFHEADSWQATEVDAIGDGTASVGSSPHFNS